MKFFLYLPVVFLYIFSVELIIIPFGIGTRALIGIFGFLYVSLIFFRKLYLNKNLITLLAWIILLTLLTLFSLSINQTEDFTFLKYPISVLIIASGSYLIAGTAPNFRNFTKFESLHVYFVSIALLQSLISLIMYFNPLFFDALNSIQRVSALDRDLKESFLDYRLLGFGANFFSLGIFYSIALLSIVFIIFEKTLNFLSIFLLCTLFIIIFVIGLSMSRSTLIGLILSFIYLIFGTGLKFKHKNRSNIHKFLLSLLVISGLAFAIILIEQNIFDKIYPLFVFAFELFINYFEQGRFESASTSHLLTMYDINFGWKTIFIGDGLFLDPSNSLLYYKETDVGFYRLILYFGIFGLFIYIMLQATPIWMIYSFSKKITYKTYSIILFFIFLMLNLKGLTDFIPYTSFMAFSLIKSLRVNS